MGRHAAEYLWPSDNIGEYSIGADFVQTDRDPEYATQGINILCNELLELSASKDREDQTVTRSINRNFGRNDYRLAYRDLNPILDQPLDKQVVEWLADASDHDVMLFCRWSLERTAHLTRALGRDQRSLTSHVLDKTEQLVDIGLFPRHAVEVTDRAARRYTFKGMDAFHSGGGQRIGFCDEHVIGLANLYHDRSNFQVPSSELKQVLFHEDMHAAGRDRGFFWGISQQLPVLRIIEEAFVEHATEVAYTRFFKQPHIIDPRRRINLFSMTLNTYVAERTFLDTICDYARIPVEHLGEAYFSPRGDEKGERLRADIERKIGKFFGGTEHFFAFVDEYEEAGHGERKKLIDRTIKALKEADHQVSDLL